MLIRQETESDYDKVYELIKEAFENAEHSDGNEHDLAVALRKSEAFVPELSLVAEVNGEIMGHIMFTTAKIENNIVLVLAPLSVSPKHQKKGIGRALISEAHKVARKKGYQYSLVLGSEKYYTQFAYLPAEEFGIKVPDGIPSANFMAIQLTENAQPVSGAVIYAKEFGI